MSETMRRLGISTVSFVLYLLFVAGGTCICLAALALAGHFLVWRGLAFPIDLALGLKLLGSGAVLLLVGTLLYVSARRAL